MHRPRRAPWRRRRERPVGCHRRHGRRGSLPRAGSQPPAPRRVELERRVEGSRECVPRRIRRRARPSQRFVRGAVDRGRRSPGASSRCAGPRQLAGRLRERVRPRLSPPPRSRLRRVSPKLPAEPSEPSLRSSSRRQGYPTGSLLERLHRHPCCASRERSTAIEAGSPVRQIPRNALRRDPRQPNFRERDGNSLKSRIAGRFRREKRDCGSHRSTAQTVADRAKGILFETRWIAVAAPSPYGGILWRPTDRQTFS